MGYTHYWYRPEELDEKRWNAFVADVQRLLDLAPHPERVPSNLHELSVVEFSAVLEEARHQGPCQLVKAVTRGLLRGEHAHAALRWEFARAKHCPHAVEAVTTTQRSP